MMKAKKTVILTALCALLPAFLLAQDDSETQRVYALAGESSPEASTSISFLNQPVSLDLQNVTVEEALGAIAQAAGFQLAYSSDFMPAEKKVSYVFRDVTAKEAIQKVSKGTGVTFLASNKNRRLIITPQEEQATSLTGTVTGTVMDASTGHPLPGANVVVKGTSLGAASDIEGNYRIEDVPPGSYRVAAMYVGHRTVTKEVTVISGEEVVTDFAMTQSLIDLDEIVVTGSISDRQKRALANPVTTITAKELELMPIDDIEDLFEGRVPGGYMLDQGFDYRTRQTISLRGSQNFYSYMTTVKTYIDGVEVADYGYSPDASLDFNNIEKIEILRGPMASTLHGSGASGGVIQIFTKKGGRSGTKINFKSYATATSTPFVDKTPFGQHHSLSLSGGTTNSSFSLGLTRSIEELPYPHNGIDDEKWRLNGGANMTAGAFRIDMKASYSTSQYGTVNNPYYAVLAEERGWINLPAFMSDIDVYDMKLSTNDQLVSLALRHVIRPGWYQNLTLGYNKSSWGNTSESPSLVWVGPPWEQVEKYSYYNFVWTKRTISYFTNTKQTFGSDFTADVTAGFEHTIQNTDYINTNLDIKPVDIEFVALDNGLISKYGYTNTGYYGEAVLGFQNRLFLTAGLRVEDNSSYGDEFEIDKNPRAGLSYVVEFGKITAKPRASWGSSTKAPLVNQKNYTENPYYINLANPDLGPETQSGFEVGADLYYGNRFSFELTYYDQTVKNAITILLVDDPETPLPEYQYRNIDEFLNKGWEFAGKLLLNPFTVNFTFTITDSKYGKNRSDTDWRYREGARIINTPEQTGAFGISYKVPALFAGSLKGGFIGLDLSYIGKMLTVNQLRLYDGYYNPDIDPITPADPEYLTEREAITKLHLRGNYWIRDYLSLFVDIVNLTDYQKGGYMEHIPTVGRISKIGFEFTF